MKQHISVFLSAALFLGVFLPVPVFAFDRELYVNSTFESLPVNSAPSDWTIIHNGNSILIKASEDKNQFVHIPLNTAANCYISRVFAVPIGGKVVLSCDVAPKETAAASKRIFDIKDSGGINGGFVSFLSNGMIALYDGTPIMSYVEDKVYTIDISADFDENKFDLYINGKKKAFAVAIGNTKDIAQIRMMVSGEASEGENGMNVDNVRVYSGTEIVNGSEFPEEEVFVNGIRIVGVNQFMEKMQNTLAFYETSNIALINGEKAQIDENEAVKVFCENGTIYIPLRFTIENLGGNVAWDESTNKTTIRFGEQAVDMPSTAIIKNDRAFLPLEDMASLTKKHTFYEDDYLAVLSDNEQLFNSTTEYSYEYEAVRRMAFENPAAEDIIRLLKEKNPNQQHPRLLVTQDDFNSIKERVKTDPVMGAWLSQLKETGDGYLDTEPLKYALPDGIRLLSVSRNTLSRVEALAFLYNITDEEKYARRAWLELENVSKFDDWNPSHFLDVAEMTAAVSLGYDWLYYYLNDEQRGLIRTAIVEKGLNQIMDDYLDLPRTRTSDWTTETKPNNWNFVCNGGLAMGALAIGDEEGVGELAGQVLENGLQSITRALKLFGPDGAWIEGISYWRYTLQYLSYYVGSMESALGTSYGRLNVPGIRQTAYFGLAATGSVGTFAFHDAPAGITNAPELFFLANKTKNPAAAGARLLQMEQFSIKPTARDLIWYRSDNCDRQSASALDKYFRIAELAAFKSSLNSSDALYLGLHAGRNDVPHAHLDAGVFEFQALGVRWAYDLGSENYNLGGSKWSLYRARPEGHSLYVINPGAEPGQDLKAEGVQITQFFSNEDGGYAIANLTGAYKDYAISAYRGVGLFNNRTQAAVRDEIKLKEPQDIYWFMQGEVDDIKIEADTAIMSKNGKRCLIKIISNHTPVLSSMEAVALENTPFIEGQNENRGIKKLLVKFENVNNLELTAILIPLDSADEAPSTFEQILPLSNWAEKGSVYYCYPQEIEAPTENPMTKEEENILTKLCPKTN